jgi:protein arginine kinase activator
MQLRNELNKAVEKEDYEKAAELRDKIYELSGDSDENQ